MTPSFAIVHVCNPQGRGYTLWIPLFLLWIPVILLSPLLFLVLVAIAIATRMTIWRVIAIFWGILSGLPGTHVNVRAQANHVLVRIL
jgi:hypothetical protein